MWGRVWVINSSDLTPIFLSLNLCSSCPSVLSCPPGNPHHYRCSSLYLPLFTLFLAQGHWWIVFRLSTHLFVSLFPQDTQSTGALPDDSGSVLMDDTSSQWSAVADTEEERRSALEKSMYVTHQTFRHDDNSHYSDALLHSQHKQHYIGVQLPNATQSGFIHKGCLLLAGTYEKLQSRGLVWWWHQKISLRDHQRQYDSYMTTSSSLQICPIIYAHLCQSEYPE